MNQEQVTRYDLEAEREAIKELYEQRISQQEWREMQKREAEERRKVEGARKARRTEPLQSEVSCGIQERCPGSRKLPRKVDREPDKD